jgi:hypothetical protein
MGHGAFLGWALILGFLMLNRFTLYCAAFFQAAANLAESSMHRFLCVLAVLAGIVFTAAGLQAQSPSQRLELDRKGETIVLEPYAPNILRVTLSLKRDLALAAPGFGFVASPVADGWNASQTAQADIYRSGRIVATVDRDLPPAQLPIQTLVNIAKFFSDSESRRAHHAAHARRQDAAGTDGLVAVVAQSKGRHV